MSAGAPPIPPPFPRLAISDLVVLTLSVAFSLACVAPSFHEALQTPDLKWWNVVPDLIDYLASGLALFGLIVMARQRIRGYRCPTSPGHWIFAAVGPYLVLMLAAVIYRPLVRAYWLSEGKQLNAINEALLVAALALGLLWSAWALRELENRWRSCILLVHGWLLVSATWLTLSAVNSLGYRAGTAWGRELIALIATFSILAGCAGIVAALLDAIRRTPRDWLHYLGVFTLTLNASGTQLSWGRFALKWWRELFSHFIP